MGQYIINREPMPDFAIGEMQNMKVVAKRLSLTEFTAAIGGDDMTDEEVLETGERLPANVARLLFFGLSRSCPVYVSHPYK